MNGQSDESSPIKETDIVFDCPFCGKSLAIDYRGAGLNVQCTDCGQNVQVPIPEGMDVSDMDSTREEQEIRILNLRRALSTAEERIRELEVDVESLRSRRSTLEHTRTEDKTRMVQMRNAMTAIRKSHDEIMKAVESIAGLIAEPEERGRERK
jgi:transcription elongation factor Elf1